MSHEAVAYEAAKLKSFMQGMRRENHGEISRV